jgi:class 3 adenylate cyclase
MVTFFGYSRELPRLSDLPLKSYGHDFSLERLVPGVDNYRCDVYLSTSFISATRKIASQLMARHIGVEKKSDDSKSGSWVKEVDSYKRLYHEVMEDGVNRAKGQREIQVIYLAQAALFKMLLEEIRSQYDHFVGRMKKAVHKSELAIHNDMAEAPKLKGKLQSVLQNRDTLQRKVGMEICGYWAEVEATEIEPMHDAIFGRHAPFFMDILHNPIPHVQQADNDFFKITEYDITLGRRIEDSDKYETLLFFVRRLLNHIDLEDPGSRGQSVEKRMARPKLLDEEDREEPPHAYHQKIDAWIRYLGNMDMILNWRRTQADYQALKKRKGDRNTINQLMKRARDQKKILHFFYQQFCRQGLMERIAASYEMQPEYMAYCPPLLPQQIVQYLTVPKARKVIRSRLKRMKKVYGHAFVLRPLHKKIKAMEQMTVAKRKSYLIRFLIAFARYHRDKSNAGILAEAMERVHPAVDEKVLALSRENNTLYEFLLSHERTLEKAPIINHVVIKADVRGSTDITYQMNERGLNPASYFSLNFFDPISETMAEYDAVKVFIEGDAVILSIFERKDTPSGWYGVARACGMALNMLIIIQRCNEKSKKYHLPILELGIGISFLEKSPAFLFDGDSRIMISSAINQADRLSSCSKTGRRLLAKRRSPFNLYVFQTLSDAEMAGTADDLYTRYNVNGIELNAVGFEKLSREIDLKLLPGDFTDGNDQKSNLYFGKFPTKSGRYQQIIIREAQVPVLDPLTLKTIRITSHKYYEICTHPKLYALARQKTA